MKTKMKIKQNGIILESAGFNTKSEAVKMSPMERTIQFILILCSILGAVGCFISGFQLEVQSELLYCSLIVIIAVFFAVFYYRKYISITIPCILVGYLLVLLAFQKQLREGSAMIANEIVYLYNEYAATNVSLFLVNYQDQVWFITGIILAVFVSIIGIVSYVVLFQGSIGVYLLVTAPFVFVCFVVGKIPATLPFILYLVTSIAIFGFGMAGYNKNYKKTLRFWVRKKPDTVLQRQIFDVLKVKVQVKVGGILLVTMTSLFLLGFLLVSPHTYQSVLHVNKIKTDMQNAMQSLEEGNFTLFNGLLPVTKITASGGLSGGNLGNCDEIAFKNETALEITTQSSQNETFYLKGYIGSQYGKNKWLPLSKDDQQEYDLTEEKLEGFESMSIFFYNMLIQFDFPPVKYDITRIDVKNINADNNNSYIPYNICGDYFENTNWINLDSNGRIQLDTRGGNQEYHLNYFQPSKDSEASLKNNGNQDIYNTLAIAKMINQKMLDNSGIDIYDSENEGLTLRDLDPSFEFSRQVFNGDNETYDLFLSNEENLNLLFNGNTHVDQAQINLNISEWYIQVENDARRFIHETYKKLPEDSFDKIKELVKDYKIESNLEPLNSYIHFKNLNALDYYKNLSERIEYVKGYLDKNTNYTLSPGRVPKGKDFVDYFLFENKKGYCMHYATAATVMFRAMGIPARYVEGYVVTKEDYEKGTKGNYYFEPTDTGNRLFSTVDMKIKDTNAHAWVEIYQDGYGWIPVEVTPAYIRGDDIVIPDVNKGINQGSNSSPLNKPTIAPAKKTASPVKKTPTPTKRPSSNGSNSDGNGSIMPGWLNQVMKIVGSLLLLIAIVGGSMLLRRGLILRKRNRYRTNPNLGKRTLSVYRDFNRIMKHSHLHYDMRKPMDHFVNQAAEKFGFEKTQNMTTFLTLVLKAKYAKEPITKEEYQEVEEYYNVFVNDFYMQASRYRKFCYKYFDVF